jgi:hypothetical protein
MLRQRTRWGAFAALLALTACADGYDTQLTNGSGATTDATVTEDGVLHDGEGQEAWCSKPSGTPAMLASLDDPCGDFKGAQILAFANEDYRTTLGIRGLYPPTELTIHVEYKGGDIFCYPAQVAPPGSRMPDIPATVSVVVEIEFTTGDGAFREVFETPLHGGPSGATFCHSFRPDELRGTYSPSLTDHQDIRVVIQGRFAGDQTSGGVIEGGVRPGRVSESNPVAYWDNR